MLALRERYFDSAIRRFDFNRQLAHNFGGTRGREIRAPAGIHLHIKHNCHIAVRRIVIYAFAVHAQRCCCNANKEPFGNRTKINFRANIFSCDIIVRERRPTRLLIRIHRCPRHFIRGIFKRHQTRQPHGTLFWFENVLRGDVWITAEQYERGERDESKWRVECRVCRGNALCLPGLVRVQQHHRPTHNRKRNHGECEQAPWKLRDAGETEGFPRGQRNFKHKKNDDE